MKNIIYSIYIENNDNNLIDRHQFTKLQLKKHYQRLIDVKKDYAKHCILTLFISILYEKIVSLS